MKNIIRISFAAMLLLAGLSSTPAQAQIAPTFATLSSAMGVGDSTVNLSSSTGVSAAGSNNQIITGIYIDREYMAIDSNINPLGTGNVWKVKRSLTGASTPRSQHASGAMVWIGPPGLFDLGVNNRSGSCTRSSLPYAPIINVRTGASGDCLGGSWTWTAGSSPRFRTSSPDPGGTAYTSLNTSGTAVGATTLYCTEVPLQGSKLLTGIGVLNGTTVTANARYVVLYDSTGVALANSALAGQASVTASVYETYAFTTKFYAVGPAQYFACLQDNAVGSTTVRMVVTGTQDNLLTKGQTGATFGTVPVLVPPTGFNSATGPYVYLY